MTFFGNRRSGRHLNRNVVNGSLDGKKKTKKKPWGWKKRLLVISGSIVGAVLVLGTGVYAYYKIAVKPPEVVMPPMHTTQAPLDLANPDTEQDPGTAPRNYDYPEWGTQ